MAASELTSHARRRYSRATAWWRIIVWITVLSYTVSMVATVEPTLRGLGQKTERADASVPPRM